MSENPMILLQYDDYAQSANTLFHFMSKSEYLDIHNNTINIKKYLLKTSL